MKACYLTCMALLAVGCAGCASGLKRDREYLELELRYLEDKVFQLESENQECHRSLESAHRENEALLRDAAGNGAASNGAASNGAAGNGARKPALRGAAPNLAPPQVELPEGEGAPPFEGPPEIQAPGPGVSEGESTDDVSAGDGESPDDAAAPEGTTGQRMPGPHEPYGGPKRKLRHYGVPSNEPPPPFKEKTADSKLVPKEGAGEEGPVRRITLNRRLTGGHDVDGQPGDEGGMVVVEPLDEAGELMEVSGDISVVVLDPAQQGEASRVARWDFTAAEAAKHLQRTPMGDGLHFTMPWPHSPPVNRTLNLYVQYTTADGRRLQAEKQIEIDPPGEIVPADSDWTRTPARISESIADDDDSDAGDELPRGRAKAVRPLTTDGDGETDSADTLKTTRRGARSSSRGPRWSPYR